MDKRGHNIIKPSNSEYASPIVVVRKKGGSIRVCVDFRELNELIECPHFPLPLIDDILDALQGTQFFTTLDLRNGFSTCVWTKTAKSIHLLLRQRGNMKF